MNFKDQTLYSAVANALGEYEKSKWFYFDKTTFPEHLLHQEVQVLVELDLDEEGLELYVTSANYSGQHWHLTNSSDYVEGYVTHYQLMAGIGVK